MSCKGTCFTSCICNPVLACNAHFIMCEYISCKAFHSCVWQILKMPQKQTCIAAWQCAPHILSSTSKPQHESIHPCDDKSISFTRIQICSKLQQAKCCRLLLHWYHIVSYCIVWAVKITQIAWMRNWLNQQSRWTLKYPSSLFGARGIALPWASLTISPCIHHS